jgi:hypothetical protein
VLSQYASGYGAEHESVARIAGRVIEIFYVGTARTVYCPSANARYAAFCLIFGIIFCVKGMIPHD